MSLNYKLKVRFLSYDEIAQRAYEILKKHGFESILPIPIEHILDNIYRLNIVPFPNLYTNFEINAFTSSDLKTIYVDEYLYTNLEKQYRFTLAHEFGHIFLHKYIYENIKINTLKDWKEFIAKVDPYEYRKLEIQADNFAGLLLVPNAQLEKAFNEQLKRIIHDIKKISLKGIKRSDYLQYVLEIIALKLSLIFQVHEQVIRIRLEKSNLILKIP